MSDAKRNAMRNAVDDFLADNSPRGEVPGLRNETEAEYDARMKLAALHAEAKRLERDQARLEINLNTVDNEHRAVARDALKQVRRDLSAKKRQISALETAPELRRYRAAMIRNRGTIVDDDGRVVDLDTDDGYESVDSCSDHDGDEPCNI